MQVLLRREVARLGQMGDVVEVKPGYARNYLLPQGLAVTLNAGNIRRVEIETKRVEEEKKALEQELTALAERLQTASVTVAAKANEEGHLFGSVAASQIAEMLQAEGYKVEERMIQLEEPIKEVGVVEVPIQLTPELASACKVWIVAE